MAKNQFFREIDLFDFTSFLVWTFFNFLAHCVIFKNRFLIAYFFMWNARTTIKTFLCFFILLLNNKFIFFSVREWPTFYSIITKEWLLGTLSIDVYNLDPLFYKFCQNKKWKKSAKIVSILQLDETAD